MSVLEEFRAFRPAIPLDKIEYFLKSAEELEAAEWYANLSRSDMTFYTQSLLYLWTNLVSEIDRVKSGDFDQMIEIVRGHLSGHPVLDFGCGCGAAGLQVLDRLDCRTDFFDVSINSLEFLEARLKTRRGRVDPPRVVRQLNLLMPHRYDVVIAYNVFEHLDTAAYKSAVRKIGTLLRPNGGILFLVTCYDTLDGEFPMHHLDSGWRGAFLDENVPKVVRMIEKWQIERERNSEKT